MPLDIKCLQRLATPCNQTRGTKNPARREFAREPVDPWGVDWLPVLTAGQFLVATLGLAAFSSINHWRGGRVS